MRIEKTYKGRAASSMRKMDAFVCFANIVTATFKKMYFGVIIF